MAKPSFFFCAGHSRKTSASARSNPVYATPAVGANGTSSQGWPAKCFQIVVVSSCVARSVQNVPMMGNIWWMQQLLDFCANDGKHGKYQCAYGATFFGRGGAMPVQTSNRHIARHT